MKCLTCLLLLCQIYTPDFFESKQYSMIFGVFKVLSWNTVECIERQIFYVVILSFAWIMSKTPSHLYDVLDTLFAAKKSYDYLGFALRIYNMIQQKSNENEASEICYHQNLKVTSFTFGYREILKSKNCVIFCFSFPEFKTFRSKFCWVKVSFWQVVFSFRLTI